MGSIKSSLFISLDGVIESPETWQFDYFNDEMGAAVGALMAGNDAMLLGRQTYDEFAAHWPNADPNDPITAQMNGSRKYVVSSTLADATWQNSSIISGDVKAEVARLKHDNHARDDRQCHPGPVAARAEPGRRTAPARTPARHRARQEAVRRRREGAVEAGLGDYVHHRRGAPRLRANRRLTERAQGATAHRWWRLGGNLARRRRHTLAG